MDINTKMFWFRTFQVVLQKNISNIKLFRGKPKVFKLQNGFIIINILFS